MSHLIETINGVLINVNDIESARRMKQINQFTKTPEISYRLQMRNGDAHIVARDTFDMFHEAGTVVAAQPGHFLLVACEDDVMRYPVVAWRIDDGLAWAIPSGGAMADYRFADEKTALLFPDGRVTDQFTTTWPDEAAWLASRLAGTP